uniref:Ig-like domain-containing protein n=1 Tax=Xenopus tropicalis TaxID=8364 RepID=A0A6I8PTS9_XENTR
MIVLIGSLLFFSLEVKCDVQLVQQKSETAKYGGNIKLWCVTSGYTFTDYYLVWLKHVPGNNILYIGRIYPRSDSTWFTPSFRGGKFTITTDNAKNMGHLQIDNVDFKDSAVYYCARDAHCEYLSSAHTHILSALSLYITEWQ